MAYDAVDYAGFIYILYTREGYGNFLAKIDQQGYTVWETDSPGNANSIIISHDFNIIAAGNSTITKISQEGELLDFILLPYAWEVHSIAGTKDNGYILSGSEIIGTSYMTAMMAKIDSAGNTIWQKWYAIPGMPYWNSLSSVIVSYDDGYIACGYAEYNSDTKIRVLKTDPDPNIITCIEPIEDQKDFVLYPNPSNGQFTVIPSNYDRITVYNISGEKIFDSSVSDTAINLTGQTAGIYFVRIVKSGKELTGKIILE